MRNVLRETSRIGWLGPLQNVNEWETILSSWRIKKILSSSSDLVKGSISFLKGYDIV